MDILVVGNGFDIAHALPTKYKDFLDICSIVKRSKVNWSGDGEPTMTLNQNNDGNSVLQKFCETMGEHAFEEFKRIIKKNFWIKHFAERQKAVGQNWIDFENEMKLTLEQLYRDMLGTTEDYVSDLSITCESIRKFCNSNNLFRSKKPFRILFEKLLDEQKELIRALELYMDGYINKLSIQKRNRITNIHVDKVLSFNYTSVYENNYGKQDVEYCYIHGKADSSSQKSRIVLGFDDHYVSDAQRVPELIPFEKYYQRIVNENDNQYIDWTDESGLRTISDPIRNVYIFGHSFGASDGDVLRKLLLYKKAKIRIYYYNEFDRGEKIKNLAMILGPDNLIELTGGTIRRIEFVKC